ncbi:MAG: CoA transferase subunit A [Desulfovibrionales bacterium]
MIEKSSTPEQALSGLRDGSIVMIGGFGAAGTPFTLIQALHDLGVRHLTLVKNDANELDMGISILLQAGQADRFIVSHMGLNATVIEMMNRGKLEVEMYPQGILAEKIRAGGAGLPGFLTDIGMETILRNQKETVRFQGQEYIVEPSIRADLALVHAARADCYGNLIFEKTARNFNPLMATAADRVVAEAHEITDTGSLDPDHVHTPGAFVDHVIYVDRDSETYGVLPNHVL